jgi:hypothetical protein
MQLLVGPTAALIPSTSLQLLREELWTMLSGFLEPSSHNSGTFTTTLWEDLEPLTNDYFLRLCAVLVLKGHSLAGNMLLVLAFQALR